VHTVRLLRPVFRPCCVHTARLLRQGEGFFPSSRENVQGIE